MYICLRSTFKKMMYSCKIHYDAFINTISTLMHMPNHLLLLHSALFVLDKGLSRKINVLDKRLSRKIIQKINVF